jgi:hypothetical protein
MLFIKKKKINKRWSSSVDLLRSDRQGGVQGGKYLERRKVKKQGRFQEPEGPAEYYSSQVSPMLLLAQKDLP